MKKILFLTLLTTLTFAQTDPNIKWLHPSPQGWDLFWMKMWDANNWYLAGGYGMFLKTTDAGQTWSTKNNAGWPQASYPEIHTYWDANEAWFFDQNNGIIAPRNAGGIIRTSDGGETFDTLRILPGTSTGNLNSIYFVNSNLGFVCGNTAFKIYKTTDGGNTWSQIPNLPDGTYNDVYATDELNIMTCGPTSGGQSAVYKTTDGGTSWNTILLPAAVTLYDLEFVNSTTGYVCGAGAFFKATTDGGNTWTGGTNTPLGQTNYKIKATSTEIYVAGNATNLFKSTDNGMSWITLNMNTPNNTTGATYCMDVFGSNIVVAGIRGYIYKSTNSGNNWDVLTDRETDGSSYRSIYVENTSGKIIVAGRWADVPGTIIISDDGGNNWYSSPQTIPFDNRLLKMQMLNNNVGYFGGEMGYLAKTTDGALSLTPITFSTLGQNFVYNMDFLSESVGWIVGGLAFSNALVAKTTDGGLTWTNQTPTPNPGNPIVQVDFVDANTGYIGGGLLMFKTTNGGTNWNSISVPGMSGNLVSIKAFDVNNIYISTSDAEFYKTTNGGVNWQSVTVPWGTSLGFGQAWYDMNNGIQFGTLGAIAKTTDAGLTWETMNTGGWTVAGGNMFHPDTFYVGSSNYGQIFRYSKPSTQTTFQLTVVVANGWNMVSIPGLNSPDQNVNTWWPDRDMGANVFRYLGGYQSVTTATPGIGYWMKNAGSNTYNTGDEWPAGGIQIVPHLPLTGSIGWNLIGGYEIAATASLVTTVPSGQQSGPIYRYSGGYQVATTIDPGYGYWIKLLSAAQIVIPESFAKESKPEEFFPDNWGKIVLTDASGVNYTLYAVKGKVNLDQYELPPAPMEGMFDIRYSSGRIAEDLNTSQSIEMNSVLYPVKIRVENMNIRIQDETGKGTGFLLKQGEEFIINDNTINKLKVLTGEVITPIEYSLEQNYPNPFNPSTTIKFSLPEATDVTLTIYNTLGQKVTELVNGKLEAGKYSYQWNAQNVATGMYIYELRSDNFVSIKKMILLK